MRAVMIDRFSTPGDLREVPMPEPGPRDVVVRVAVAGINPVDWKIRAGKSGERPMPMVLGLDFAGRVERVGAEVTSFAPGDRVVGTARNRHGAFADYTVVTEGSKNLAFAKIPDGISDDVAAALPIPALTALASLALLALPRGATLAIVGAAGSLGAAAVQLAKRDGLRTIAVVTARQAEAARGFGADATVDSGGDVAAQIRALAPDGLSGVLDGVAADQKALSLWTELLAPAGKLVSTNHAADEAWFAERGFVATNVTLFETPQSSEAGLQTLFTAIAEGALRVEVGERVPLDRASATLDRGESHDLHGKAVVAIG